MLQRTQWKTENGDTRDEAEFHRIVAWDKLAEICSQLLKKGRKVFVEGRLQTRRWQTKEGEPRTTTEIVISDMIVLDRMGDASEAVKSSKEDVIDVPDDFEGDIDVKDDLKPQSANVQAKPDLALRDKTESKKKEDKKPEEGEEDIPF
jgi:single-strand DNA-binding protein